MKENNGARSYKAEVVGSDSMAITLNFKFLLNIFAIFGSLIFAYTTIEKKLFTLETQLENQSERIQKLEERHQREIEQLEKAWYDKANPLKWGKTRK
tara:strand:- start:2418 stop:2708 length:291 start_codon:yes stop_codon:yes gene_type:complete